MHMQTYLQQRVQLAFSPSGKLIVKVLAASTFVLMSLFLPRADNTITAQSPVEGQSLQEGQPLPEAQQPLQESDSGTTGIWISREELALLPTSGPAWNQLKKAADQPAGLPSLSDQNSDANVNILAKALVYARTNQPHYRTEVAVALQIITFNNIEDEGGGSNLAISRELAAYVIAADLIDLRSYDPTLDAQFRARLRQLLTKRLPTSSSSRSIKETHEMRPNNWGTLAGASRAAIAAYLGDQAELERTATVFHGWLGNLSAYNGFNFDDDLSWQCDPNHPVPINPPGCTKAGYNLDGALPEEMRRGASFQWPPVPTGYPWEALQGAIVQAEILHRAGYPTWEWENRALLRAVLFLYRIGWGPEGDDRWQIWLVNDAYGPLFPVPAPVGAGKNMGWTDWTHAPRMTGNLKVYLPVLANRSRK